MTREETAPLASLGWDGRWAAAWRAALKDHRSRVEPSPARIVAEHRDRYVVAAEDGERTAVLAGRARNDAAASDSFPAVGDWVGITLGDGDGASVIRFSLERRSAFVRKAAGKRTDAQVVAANVDVALIATAIPTDLSARRLERYLTLAWESGAMPVIVLTKCDLADDPDALVAEATLAAPGVEVVAVSGTTGVGIDLLARVLRPSETSVLIGSSGVGKSTLVNRLLGVERQRTSQVTDVGKGRHTTTYRELIRLETGALLIDTPGMRELQLWSADDGVDAAFADLDAHAGDCRFRDCVHDAEPGCAVRAAVESGALSAERLAHWHQLRRELAYLARKQDERVAAEMKSRVRSLTRGLRSRLRDKYGGS